MFSTLHRFSQQLFNKTNQRSGRSNIDLTGGCEVNADQNPKDEPDFSSNRVNALDKRGIKNETRRSQRLKGRISQLTFKNRLEFEIDSDITRGHEKYRIPAVSYKRNDTAPCDFHYVPEYVQYDDMHLDSTLKIMSSCQCLGDCSDGACACSSSHRTGRAYNSKGNLSSSYNVDAPQVLYECNAGCSCNRKLCKNAVIQRGAQGKFVLFRTRSRGWGIRTLETLKRGSFVGVYSGELISVSESRRREDDTYLFNLANSQIVYVRDEQNQNIVEPSSDVQANTDDQQNGSDQDGEDSFVCDAKYYGNFTRFINHSCEPNVIGIRSFTKHHDSRFPYIAFFTNKEIPANNELTLNYGDNYWLVKCRRDHVYCLCGRACCRFNRKNFTRGKPGATN